MLNQDQPGPQPGEKRQLLGLVVTSEQTLIKFYKIRINDKYSIRIIQTNVEHDGHLHGIDTITIPEEYFNEFVDGLLGVMDSIEKELNDEPN